MCPSTSLSVLPQAELHKMKQQVEETKQNIVSQEAEERKLLEIVADADTEQIRQKKQLDQVKE